MSTSEQVLQVFREAVADELATAYESALVLYRALEAIQPTTVTDQAWRQAALDRARELVPQLANRLDKDGAVK